MNGKNQIITLRKVTTTTDADGFATETASDRNVFGDVRSVTGTEFSQMGRLNIQASLSVTLWEQDYDNEKLVIISGKEYAVYRTYAPNQDEIELKLEERAGLS